MKLSEYKMVIDEVPKYPEASPESMLRSEMLCKPSFTLILKS